MLCQSRAEVYFAELSKIYPTPDCQFMPHFCHGHIFNFGADVCDYHHCDYHKSVTFKIHTSEQTS